MFLCSEVDVAAHRGSSCEQEHGNEPIYTLALDLELILTTLLL